MKKIKKDALKGQNLFHKLLLYSFLSIYFPLFFLINYTIDHPTYGLIIIAAICSWFLLLVYVNKIKENKVLKSESGKRLIEGDADHGNGYCNDYELKIRGKMYTMDDANEYVKKRVEIAELENAKLLMKKYNLAQKNDPESYPFNKPLLTLKEIEDLQYYAGLEFGSEKRISRKATAKFIKDKVIEGWYEDATKQSPFEQNPITNEVTPTKEYLQWQQSISKLQDLLNAQIKQQLDILQKNKQSVKNYEYTLIAETIARQFSRYQIKSAIDTTKDGRAVHIWLQRFENYSALIKEKRILEKALEIADSNNLPEFCMIIEQTKLESMVKTIVPVEETCFKHELHLPFKLIIIYFTSYFVKL